jgi:hypothetical protein
VVDYEGSAVQHHGDGELLHGNAKFAGADQLAGFAAECAIKHLLVGVANITVDASGNVTGQYRKHVDRLWGVATSLVAGVTHSTYFAPLLGGNAFSDWSIDDRYMAGSFAKSGQSIGANDARKHLDAAEALIKQIEQAKLDGVIS